MGWSFGVQGVPLIVDVFLCISRLLYQERIHLGSVWTRKTP